MTAYATLQQMRDWMGGSLTVVTDPEMERALASATSKISHACKRRFDNVTEARSFSPPVSARCVHLGPFNDLVSATIVATDEGHVGTFVAWAGADYALEKPDNVDRTIWPNTTVRSIGRSFPSGSIDYPNSVRITGTWGWAAVPEDITQATLIAAHRLFTRRDSPGGVAGFGEFGVVKISKLDSDVEDLISPYRLRSLR